MSCYLHLHLRLHLHRNARLLLLLCHHPLIIIIVTDRPTNQPDAGVEGGLADPVRDSDYVRDVVHVPDHMLRPHLCDLRTDEQQQRWQQRR